jgi:DNA-binding response OmpR family regulator
MHRYHGRGCGPLGHGRRLSREEWLRRLEEYQRDLEQEIADVADLIRRLRDEKPAEPAAA